MTHDKSYAEEFQEKCEAAQMIARIRGEVVAPRSKVFYIRLLFETIELIRNGLPHEEVDILRRIGVISKKGHIKVGVLIDKVLLSNRALRFINNRSYSYARIAFSLLRFRSLMEICDSPKGTITVEFEFKGTATEKDLECATIELNKAIIKACKKFGFVKMVSAYPASQSSRNDPNTNETPSNMECE